MSYHEYPSGVPGVVLWQNTGAPGGTTVLPDGCLDLIWNGTHLVVAGPDTRARRHHGTTTMTGLRFSHGVGPAVLGVPADVVRDELIGLDTLWPDRAVHGLAARVAEDPLDALACWAGAACPHDADPFGARVFGAAGAGLGVAEIADHFGVTARTLHRRCLPLFGYGPQHLARVLRLQRALAAARRGRGWAELAAAEGYADQAHLAREVRALAATTPTVLLDELITR